jgi:hypothetical protein
VNHLFDLYPGFKLKGVALVPFHSKQAYSDNIAAIIGKKRHLEERHRTQPSQKTVKKVKHKG